MNNEKEDENEGSSSDEGSEEEGEEEEVETEPSPKKQKADVDISTKAKDVEEISSRTKDVEDGDDEEFPLNKTQKGNFTTAVPPVILKFDNLNPEGVRKFEIYIKWCYNYNRKPTRANLLEEGVSEQVMRMFKTKKLVTTTDPPIMEWTDKRFLAALLKAYPRNGVNMRDSLEEQISKVDFKWTWDDVCFCGTYIGEIDKLVKDFVRNGGTMNSEKVKSCCSVILKSAKRDSASVQSKPLQKFCKKLSEGVKFKDMEEFFQAMMDESSQINATLTDASDMGMSFVTNKTASTGVSKSTAPKTLTAPKNNDTRKSSECYCCGRPGHIATECFHKDHPDRNEEIGVQFTNSVKGKLWLEKHKATVLPARMRLDGTHWVSPNEKKAGDSSNPKKRKVESGGTAVHPRSECFCNQNVSTCSIILSEENDSVSMNEVVDDMFTNPINCTVLCNNDFLVCETLIDTGCLQSNVIDEDVAAWLMSHGAAKKRVSGEVCSAFAGECKALSDVMHFTISFLNLINKRSEEIEVSALVIKSRFPVVIGLPTILRHGLLSKLFLMKSEVIRNENDFVNEKRQNDDENRNLVTQTDFICNTIFQKSDLLDYVDEDDQQEMGEFKDHFDFSNQTEAWNATEIVDFFKAQMQEENPMNTAVLALVEKHVNLFSNKLRGTSARVAPMTIQVDLAKWETNKNNLSPRIQTPEKEQEINKQIATFLKMNVIRLSQEAYYSQVNLQRKPGKAGSWRFCIDFRNLNDATRCMGWPLPNIKEIIRRIGAHKPRYFAKMDLTSGYHQTPLAAACSASTAFITHSGVYEWLRVPMGLKGATSYFQQQMSIILNGLNYKCCEVYLDDIIVFGTTLEEFLSNLELVLQRFSEHEITLSPEKCIFNSRKISFLGYEIDENGVSFSRDRIDGVLNVPLPVTLKQLRSFIGLAKYFGTHVPNMSVTAGPLNALATTSTKTKPIVWNNEALLAFEQIKRDIDNCEVLFFIDDKAPIILHTDACDFGIGAFLFQHIDGVDRTIAILSKSFSGPQRRWSTAEQEAYAIYYSLMKWEHLLRAAKFELRTDHKNLTYMNKPGSSEKVTRWKLAVQDFDFELNHIPGVENVVADPLSRLCTTHDQQILAVIELKVPTDKYKVISAAHNSMVGHHGVERTINLLNKNKQDWLNRRAHVKQFIRDCPLCQKMSFIKVPIQTHPFTTSTYRPMERLNIDSIGPLPIDSEGFQHIMVVVDCFTRFVELYRLRDVTASAAANALLQHFGRYGTPEQILTDGGTQFDNNWITELSLLTGVQRITGLAYSKEEQSIVERMNKEVGRHLRAIVYENNIMNDWSQSLYMVQRIINATVNSSIGVSPASLLFGNAIDLDRGILAPLPVSTAKDIALSAWASDMLEQQRILMEKSEKILRSRDEENIFKRSGIITQYEIGSYVLIEYPSSNLKKGAPNKLMTNLKGPYKVVSVEGDAYNLENLTNNQIEKVHLKRLHEFRYDPVRTNPRDVSHKDYNFFNISEVVKHRGGKLKKGIKKSNLTFFVKWVDDPIGTWEPWHNLASTAALHLYLRDRKAEYLIPTKFTCEIDQQC